MTFGSRVRLIENENRLREGFYIRWANGLVEQFFYRVLEVRSDGKVVVEEPTIISDGMIVGVSKEFSAEPFIKGVINNENDGDKSGENASVI